eukprot:8920710-Pyramimonas_sp.AAC.1
MAQDGLQDGQDGPREPNIVPTWPPRRSQDASNTAKIVEESPRRPKSAQEAPETAEEASKRFSRKAQRGQNP